MTPLRSLSSRVLVAVVLAVATSAAVIPALDAPQPAPANVTAVVVDHWPPHDDDLYGPHFITARPDSQVWYEDFFSTRLVKSEGFKVTVHASKNIVARIKATGEIRVSIDRVGSLTREGVVSSDRALTHLRDLSSQQIIQLVNRARDLVGVPK